MFNKNKKNKKTVEINREWIEHLAHMAICESSYSVEALRAYILSGYKLTQNDND